MPRTVLLYLLPAALVATGWSRLIDGVDERAVLALLALALAPALGAAALRRPALLRSARLPLP